jgi:hypothetical protein
VLLIGRELCALSLPSLCEIGGNDSVLVEIHVIQTGYELRGISFKLLHLANHKKKHTSWLTVSCEYGANNGM